MDLVPVQKVVEIHQGNCLEVLTTLPDKSVQLVVTSPPYGALKDYGQEDQIGLLQSHEDYLSSLMEVWKECYRVLSPGCKMCINVGDVFVRTTKEKKYHVVPLHAQIWEQLLRLPDVRPLGNIIWVKSTNTSTSGGCSLMGSMYYPRDGGVIYKHEYVLIVQKPGRAPKPAPGDKSLSQLTKDQRAKWFVGLWGLAPARQTHHPAPFPETLPGRLIRMYTFHGETVLDPFMGSGTTALAAKKAGRKALGIELNPDFITVAQERLQDVKFVPNSEYPT